MKTADLTNNLLVRMSPAARKQLGVQTSEEAQAAFVAKNERELHNQIANILRLRRIWFCHSRTDLRTRQALGVPDFLFAHQGAAMAFEVKFAKGKLRPEQETTHEQMRANGWRVHVVRSLEEAKRVLDEGREG